MMLLGATMAQFVPPQNQTNYVSFKRFDKCYPKMYFLINLNQFLKRYGYLCHILACFTIPIHQYEPFT